RELSVVEDVEELEAELGSDALADLRILEQREIPLIDARRAQEIAAGISERSIDRPSERERVDVLNRRIKIPHTGARQPARQLRFHAITRVRISAQIIASHAPSGIGAQRAGIAVRPHRKRLSAPESGDSGDLPSVQ